MTILFWIFMAMLGKATQTGWSRRGREKSSKYTCG